MKTRNISTNSIRFSTDMIYGHGGMEVIKSGTGYNNINIDYYGIVPSSAFVDGDTLTSTLGVTQGKRIVGANDCDWFKVKYGEKILFIPKMTFRHEISWQHLYDLGLVYGVDGFGYDGGGVLQNKTIKLGKFTYKVRLFNSDSVTTIPNNTDSISSSYVFSGAEWNDVFYRFAANSTVAANDKFESFSNTELGVGTGGSTPGTYTWTSTRAGTNCIVRGWNGVTFFSSKHAPVSTQIWMGWRPVLELVQ